MINNVMVKVVGEQKSNRDESAVEPIELVTNGNLHEKNGIFYLKYDEYYEDLDKPVKNLLKFDADSLSLTKKGDVSSEMSFKVGETVDAYYSTPAGFIPMSILTEGYQMEKTDTGVNIAIAYIMDYGNDCLSFNVLRISVEQ